MELFVWINQQLLRMDWLSALVRWLLLVAGLLALPLPYFQARRVGEVAMVADQAHYAGLSMFAPGAQVRLGIDPTQVRFLDR